MSAVTASGKPSLRVERALQREGHHVLAGMDEVGRGALAGPVSVGVVVIDEGCRSAPVGVKDSKLLTHQMRERMVPMIHRWAKAYAVGHASPGEIDRFGIMVALRMAGTRALAALPAIPDLVILDGNYDWLTDPGRVGLLGFLEDGVSLAPCIPVRTMIKADLFCSSVAAASVLAKVERDAMMVALALEVPDYAWQLNKGYCAPEHFAALQAHGPSMHHRQSWRLPGLSGPAGEDQVAAPEAAPLADAMMDDGSSAETERGGER